MSCDRQKGNKMFEKFRKKKQESKPEYPQFLYTEEELDEYEEYVRQHFGPYEKVLHEIVSPNVHLDVIIIPPTEEEDYYKFVTMGAGAYRMNVPEELDPYELWHAEYVIYLPKDWKITSDAPEDYWPIGMLKKIARVPINCDTWLGFGHTIHGDAEQSPFAPNTKLNSFLLLNAVGLDRETCSLRMQSGKLIRFYQLAALYQEELEYKMNTDVGALFERFPDEAFPPVIRPDRDNYCEREDCE